MCKKLYYLTLAVLLGTLYSLGNACALTAILFLLGFIIGYEMED